MTWPEVERAVLKLSRPATADLLARAARQALPAVAALEPKYGPEALEWLAACQATLARVEAVARGEAVSRFQLDLAADAARCAATATATAARQVGPSPLIEAAELAYAAVAFAADCLRTAAPPRAAAFGMQSLRAAAGGGEVPAEWEAELLSR
jgi:hypothetical protein